MVDRSADGSTHAASTSLRSERSAERRLPRRRRSRSRAKRSNCKIGVAPNFALASQSRETKLKGFHYVYILKSLKDPGRYYTGLTDDLEARLNKHNEGACSHTAKYRPWRIETAIAFRSPEKAATFEKYLKSHSGRAFAKKPL